MTTNKFVNGPINAFRLEGKIGDIEKIIYIFMDIHEPIYSQTKCPNIRNEDITSFFQKNFDNISKTNKIFDFFFEIHPSDVLKNPTTRKLKYINEINDLFIKSFNFDPEKNKVGVSKEFKNIRLHYIDIRDFVTEHINIFKFSGCWVF